MGMTDRAVVEQRITTLTGLLETPGGPLGPAAGKIGEELLDSWRAERRLLQRILKETVGEDVSATISLWYERTAAFAERSDSDRPAWRDREGNLWVADDVLRSLDDMRQRIAIWLADEGRSQPDPEGQEPTNDAPGEAES